MSEASRPKQGSRIRLCREGVIDSVPVEGERGQWSATVKPSRLKPQLEGLDWPKEEWFWHEEDNVPVGSALEVAVCTRAGRTIRATLGDPIESTLLEIQAKAYWDDRKWDRLDERQRPRIVRRPDASYNCVGHVFASRRCWLDPDLVRTLLHEDGFELVEQGSVQPGDVAVWTMQQFDMVSHVAFVSDVRHVGYGGGVFFPEVFYHSKMNKLWEVIHVESVLSFLGTVTHHRMKHV